MDLKEFLTKHNLINENIDVAELISFMIVLDYLYCAKTKEQIIDLVTDYYYDGYNDDFLEKWELISTYLSTQDMVDFLLVIEYLCCTKSIEEIVELVNDYYDNCDDIYNSTFSLNDNNYS